MKIFVTVPTVSALHLNPHPRLLDWLADNKLRPQFVDNFMPQWCARVEIVRRFLASNADDLLMIDYDTVPTFQLSEFYYLWNPRRIVAGYYALYTDQGMFQWSLGRRVHTGTLGKHPVYMFTPDLPLGGSSWDVCGFGCVLFPRSIVAKLHENGVWEHAIPIPGGTEDTPVCEAAKTLKYEIVTGQRMRCEHWRTVDISRQLEIQTALIAGKTEIGQTKQI